MPQPLLHRDEIDAVGEGVARHRVAQAVHRLQAFLPDPGRAQQRAELRCQRIRVHGPSADFRKQQKGLAQ